MTRFEPDPQKPQHAEDCDPRANMFAARPDEVQRAELLANFSGLSGRVGIVGGTFDPPHLGHLALAAAALERHSLDKVVFVPTLGHPMKAEKPIASPEDRIEMLRLLLAGDQRYAVCSFEIDQGRFVPTFETVERARQDSHNLSELFLILGGDWITKIGDFREIHRILKSAQVALVSRDSWTASHLGVLSGRIDTTEQAQLVNNFVVMTLVPVSSTDLRGQLAGGTVPGEKLGASVAEYIKNKGLYS